MGNQRRQTEGGRESFSGLLHLGQLGEWNRQPRRSLCRNPERARLSRQDRGGSVKPGAMAGPPLKPRREAMNLEQILHDHKLWLAGQGGRQADLRGANLWGADLRGANLDFSAWPLSCGSFGVKVDDRIVAQLFCHIARLDVSGCSPVVRYAHRVIFSTWPGKWLKNLFSEYRDDVEKI